jgi:predicted ArsR family transcriptional regulator
LPSPDRGTRSHPGFKKLTTTSTSPHLGQRILRLLAEHESLAYEQVAVYLGEPPHEVRAALSQLRGIGLVDAISVGELEMHTTRSVAYWRLTEKGRHEAARLRDSGA